MPYQPVSPSILRLSNRCFMKPEFLFGSHMYSYILHHRILNTLSLSTTAQIIGLVVNFSLFNHNIGSCDLPD